MLAKQAGVPTVYEDDEIEVSISLTRLGKGDIQTSCDLVKCSKTDLFNLTFDMRSLLPL